MGRRLSLRKDPPQLILISTSERTRQTMSLLKAEAGWSDVSVVEKEWLYLASAKEYVRSIEKLHDELDHVCFCGHNPSITSVVNHFSGEDIGSMPTCAVAVIEFDTDTWKAVSAGTGKMIHYDFPKRLEN